MNGEVIDRADVVVVGSGAGGGLLAAELGHSGLEVLVVETGDWHGAESYARFELRARRRLWWPTRLAETRDDGTRPLPLLAGRCVGGTTVINTRVAMRAAAFDIAKFHARTGLTGNDGRPFSLDDLNPWYDRVEAMLDVRERADWTPSVYKVRTGFRAMDADLEPVRSYTDYNCSRCGSCLDGCPTNAGRSALNTFVAPALGRGEIRLRPRTTATRVLVDRRATPQVDGVEVETDGQTGVIQAPIVVLAAGALNTPQILLRSPDVIGLETPSTRLVGTVLGLHPSRLVYGLFDEVQDCHRAYPISAHCVDRQNDADGGFVVEATTIQEPVALAESLVDDDGKPLWGHALVDVMKGYRHWVGLLVMATDENTGTVELDETGAGRFRKRFSASELARIDAGRAFATDALRAAGARRVVTTGLFSTHHQGSTPMGDDPRRSVVDGSGRAHDVAGLYVGDGSLIPASLSVNPSLTIMAFAAKIAGGLTGAVAA